jgi:hypothetical protein
MSEPEPLYSEPVGSGLKAVGPNEPGREIAHRIKPPNGVMQEQWIAVIEFAVTNFRLSHGGGTPDKPTLRALDIDDIIPEHVWNLIFDYGHNRELFLEALAVRGVVPLGRGLTAQQSLALDILTDPNVTGTWKTRLRKAGLTELTLSRWMQHPPFEQQFKAIAQQRMNNMAPAVDVVLTAQALEGSMDAIKYFDKRVGRDPDKKQEMDGRRVVGIVLDSMTKHLSSMPGGMEVLQKIADEIDLRMKIDGNIHN